MAYYRRIFGAIEGMQEVRFVNATDATTRWGKGVSSGVTEVISGNS